MASPATDMDSLAVRQTVLDYWESWFEGNAERMQRSLHPGLAKRSLKRDPQTEKESLYHLTQEQMVTFTQAGEGTHTPPGKRYVTLIVLDVYEEIACVKCESYDYLEYLHLAKHESKWVIVNSLYTSNRAKQ